MNAAPLPERLDAETLDLIERALQEDGAGQDVTSLLVVPEDAQTEGTLYARAAGILCGSPLFAETFKRLDPSLEVRFEGKEGAALEPDQVVARVLGKARAILSAERVALNLLGRLSGIATETARYVEAVSGTRAKICDTRKTAPLWRRWDKYAVRVGGGTNHRFNLEDMILIKDNHIALAGGVIPALRAAKTASGGLPIEIEVETLEQLEEVLSEGVDRVMLDNMPLDKLREAVRINAGRALLEASGGVRLENVRAIAETGVSLMSIGALTHSVRWFDFSVEVGKSI